MCVVRVMRRRKQIPLVQDGRGDRVPREERGYRSGERGVEGERRLEAGARGVEGERSLEAGAQGRRHPGFGEREETDGTAAGHT